MTVDVLAARFAFAVLRQCGLVKESGLPRVKASCKLIVMMYDSLSSRNWF